MALHRKSNFHLSLAGATGGPFCYGTGCNFEIDSYFHSNFTSIFATSWTIWVIYTFYQRPFTTILQIKVSQWTYNPELHFQSPSSWERGQSPLRHNWRSPGWIVLPFNLGERTVASCLHFLRKWGSVLRIQSELRRDCSNTNSDNSSRFVFSLRAIHRQFWGWSDSHQDHPTGLNLLGFLLEELQSRCSVALLKYLPPHSIDQNCWDAKRLPFCDTAFAKMPLKASTISFQRVETHSGFTAVLGMTD